ncbi:MAG: hypothetical protein ACR2Q4_07125, partial [Geminicoccaceae bacterium]
EGPERIAPEWWVGAVSSGSFARETRDYYRVEDDQGQRYWLFRAGLYETAECPDGNTRHQVNAAGRPGWFIHGFFG